MGNFGPQVGGCRAVIGYGVGAGDAAGEQQKGRNHAGAVFSCRTVKGDAALLKPLHKCLEDLCKAAGRTVCHGFVEDCQAGLEGVCHPHTFVKGIT
ncbi:hypothetical protein SDC9_114203 [bioreactor metagenome]|uniref:Uncharacterized protein n=1 Tax=bioreactor metagenome TaxID=1076179 RepID=A0A645BRP0_9ZZZZ